MFAIILAIVLSPTPLVEIELLPFKLSPGIAEQNWRAARLHDREVIDTMPETWQRSAWSLRQEPVTAAWRNLHAAMTAWHPSTRLDALKNLRLAIGDDAYYAGRMPSPIPDYTPWLPYPPAK